MVFVDQVPFFFENRKIMDPINIQHNTKNNTQDNFTLIQCQPTHLPINYNPTNPGDNPSREN